MNSDGATLYTSGTIAAAAAAANKVDIKKKLLIEMESFFRFKKGCMCMGNTCGQW